MHEHGLAWLWSPSRFELTLLLAIIFISACFISDHLGLSFWDLAGKSDEDGKYSIKQQLLRIFLFLNLLLFTLVIISAFL
ncbi:hypothetical protein Pan241w_46940 [Gimesia alba]|uniref:Uncharacterized protein n=1 Tax=Gimesia alba TaxID=2527973 RepID=A0A517RL76_9PLAN|nr:hypothetical protein Pan241w_46940 [Gimesia alba]